MAVREPCRYGERCYRGEAHRAECSHPGDADWPLALEPPKEAILGGAGCQFPKNPPPWSPPKAGIWATELIYIV